MTDLKPGAILAHITPQAPGEESPFAIGLILRRAHDRAAASLVKALRPQGLELRHFAVLIALSTNGPTSQRDLVAHSGSDKASMVRVIDNLEAARLVERLPYPGDRRIHMIGMTPKGRSTFEAVHVAAEDIPHQLFEHMKPGHEQELMSLLTEFAYPDSPSSNHIHAAQSPQTSRRAGAAMPKAQHPPPRTSH
jgi:DNA-binding MarR family transcriptional regulator